MKRENKDFSSEILNLAFNPSANEPAGRGRYWKHDAAKNVLEFFEFRASGSADDYRQLKVHQKRDAKAQKICYMGLR